MHCQCLPSDPVPPAARSPWPLRGLGSSPYAAQAISETDASCPSRFRAQDVVRRGVLCHRYVRAQPRLWPRLMPTEAFSGHHTQYVQFLVYSVQHFVHCFLRYRHHTRRLANDPFSPLPSLAPPSAQPRTVTKHCAGDPRKARKLSEPVLLAGRGAARCSVRPV